MATAAHGSVSSRKFTDPDQYQAAIFGGDNLYSLLGRGAFSADLIDMEAGQVRLQSGRENLPRLAASGISANKVGILVWFGTGQLPVVRGAQIGPGELLCLGRGMQSHHRTCGSNEFATLTLDPTDLAHAAHDLTGRDVTITAGEILRPPAHLHARLLSAIKSAIHVGETAPNVLSSAQAVSGLEQILLRLVIACLQHVDTHRASTPHSRRAAAAKEFEEIVNANLGRSISIRELSLTIGMPERSLRKLCHEQMGISPVRFLALRRLHLARQALLRADHRSATVTEIALDFGMWEFGRFSMTYKALFGESPSITLRRRPEA